jgi:arginase family enzyme
MASLMALPPIDRTTPSRELVWASLRTFFGAPSVTDYGSAANGGSAGWYDIESESDYLVGVTMADVGDVAIQGSEVERNFERISQAVERSVERGALPVAVGGDHSMSYPRGRGMHAFGGVDVVSLDAHADFVDEMDGARYTGASEMRRLSELPFVRSVTLLGLRNVAREEIDAMREHGVRWATSLELERAPADAVRRVATWLVTHLLRETFDRR